MINDHLHLSKQAGELLKGIEALRLKPYDDQTGKPCKQWCAGATIGYGHLILAKDWCFFADGICKEEANLLFLRDAEPIETLIKQQVFAPLTQAQFDALMLLVFNIGGKNFKQSSVLRLVNDPAAVTAYVSLDSAWLAWNKSQGRVSNGLKNRRRCELAIFRHGIYERW